MKALGQESVPVFKVWVVVADTGDLDYQYDIVHVALKKKKAEAFAEKYKQENGAHSAPMVERRLAVVVPEIEKTETT